MSNPTNKEWEEFDKEFVDPQHPIALLSWIKTEEIKNFIRTLILSARQDERKHIRQVLSISWEEAKDSGREWGLEDALDALGEE